MRYLRKAALLSTALTGLLLFASSAAAQSFAFSSSVTNMGLLRPANKWRVNAIYIPHGRYCAMANTFSKQISLAFARSPDGYGSLAIDFPGNILQAGKTYSLALQVDDDRMRVYKVPAVSARSLIVQIGRDSAFYKALAGNGTLRVSLPSLDMRFDLSRFAGSYISLISCADQLSHTHIGPRTAAVPVQPVAVTALGASNTAAGQMAKAASEAKSKLASAQQDETGIGDKIDVLQTEKSKLAGRLDMQGKQYKLMQIALKGKEQDLAAARTKSADNSKALKAVKKELASLRHENAKQIISLTAELKQKSKQYDKLQQKFMLAEAKAKSARDQETQDEADLAFIRQQLTQTQERLVTVEQEKKTLASETQKSETAYRDLQQQLSKARAQIAGLKGQAALSASQIPIKNNGAQTSQVTGATTGPAAGTAMEPSPVPLTAEKTPAATASQPLRGYAPAPQEAVKSSGSGIFSYFPFSLFHHEEDKGNISSSENSRPPAIVPPSQGENGQPSVPVLNASNSRANGAADPMDGWKTVIIQ